MKSESIGQRIRRLRLERGWLIRDLGEAARVDYKQISNWENDRWNMGLFTAIQLAQAFQVSLDYFCGLSDNPQQPPRPVIDSMGENLRKVKP